MFNLRRLQIPVGGLLSFLNAVPCKDKLVQWWNKVVGGVAIDKVGVSGSEVGREGKNGTYFDGDGVRYVDLGLQLLDGDFEIEIIAEFSFLPGSNRAIISQYLSGNPGRFWVGQDTSGNLTIQYGSDTRDVTLSDGTYKIEVKRIGNTIEFYVDGNLEHSFTNANLIAATNTEFYNVGGVITAASDNLIYGVINGIAFNFEESNTDTKVIGTSPNGPVIGEIQNATGSDRVSTTALESRADIDGYTTSDSASYYYDSGLTQLIPSGVIIPTLNGKAMAYTTGGVLADAEFSGELKANVRVIDGVIDNGVNYENWTAENAQVTISNNVIRWDGDGAANGANLQLSSEIADGQQILLVFEVDDTNLNASDLFVSSSSAFPSTQLLGVTSPGEKRYLLTADNPITNNQLTFISAIAMTAGEYVEISKVRHYDASIFTDPLTDPLPTTQKPVSGNSLINETTKYSVVEADNLTTVQMYDHTDPDAVVAKVVPVDDFPNIDGDARFSTKDVDGTITEQLLYSEALTEPCYTKANKYMDLVEALTDSEGSPLVDSDGDPLYALKDMTTREVL